MYQLPKAIQAFTLLTHLFRDFQWTLFALPNILQTQQMQHRP
jgi:hypothetical protein